MILNVIPFAIINSDASIRWSLFFNFLSQSLCNACGIRYRKKRRQDLGLDLNQPQKQEHGEVIPEVKDSNSNSNSGSGNSSSNLQVVPKRRLLMGVEEAALLLMTLSSPSASTLLHGWQYPAHPQSPNVHSTYYIQSTHHQWFQIIQVSWFIRMR